MPPAPVICREVSSLFLTRFSIRLLLLIELPSLDGVLTHDAVDGKHIVHNVGSVARLVGRACSSAAQTCLAAAVSAGPSTSSKPRPQTPGRALAPASHVTRRRSLHMQFHKLQDWSDHTHKSTEGRSPLYI